MVHIKSIDIFLIFLLVVSAASGYVRTSNSYYTEGGEVIEDTLVNNMAYNNQVSIYQDSLFAEADAVLADNSLNGSFENHIQTMGDSSIFGADVYARSDKQFNYHRSIATGVQVSDKTALTYTLQSGKTRTDYFTDRGSVQEGIAVKNVKYVDNAGVYPHTLFGSGDADLVDGIGGLMDVILVNSKDGSFGTGFLAMAKDRLNYEKNFAAGAMTNDKAEVSYVFESGIADMGYFNPSTSVNEFIFTDDSMYKEHIKNTANNIRSDGRGQVTKDAPSMFKHDIQMSYGGKHSVISAALNTSIGKYGSESYMPVVYTWNTLVDSDENRAIDLMTTKAYNGNRNIAMQTNGRADGLTDKRAGPLYISPIGFIGISKELYMSYEITR